VKKYILPLLLLVLINDLAAQKKDAFVIYDSKGKKVSYATMLKSMSEADVALFGEQHNCAIAHWLQLETLKDLYRKRKLTLGAEMIEADNQSALDLFVSGKINQKAFDTLARLWPNYKTDYAPLVNFAKDSHLVFVATNIPRKYANLVFKRGFQTLDSLTALEKTWMAPLPMAYDSTLPGYLKIIEMMGGHGGSNMPKAQATKDATMAYFTLKNYIPGNLFVHFNGAFHSDNFEGILWYLKKDRPNLKYITISTVTQENIYKLLDENKAKADFIICVDEDMTTTY